MRHVGHFKELRVEPIRTFAVIPKLPVRSMLGKIDQSRLQNAAKDEAFLGHLGRGFLYLLASGSASKCR
jgi:hypothetical protein